MTRNERIIALRVQGLTYEAIGAELGVHPVIARNICTRAMKRGQVAAEAIGYKPHSVKKPHAPPYHRLYERLTARMTKHEATGCWLWTGPYHKSRPYAANRYGYISVWDGQKNKSICTHRAMWIAVHGPITAEQHVCHRCDVPLCINPGHLFLGDHDTNMADSRAKGRHFLSAKTHCKRGHALVGDNVRVRSDGCRSCETCSRARLRIQYGWPEDLAYSLPKGSRLPSTVPAALPKGER